MPRYLSHIVLVIVLSLTTLWIIQSKHRYTPVTSDVTQQMQIPADFAGWHFLRGATQWHDRHQRVLRLDARGIETYTFLSKLVANPQQYENLKLSVDMRADKAFNESPDAFGGMVMLCIDAHNKILTYWPNTVADVRHVDTWRSFAQVIPVHSDCQKLAVEIYVTAPVGKIFAKNFEVSAQAERTSFRVARIAIMVAWLLVFLLTCRRIAQLRSSWWSTALVYAVGGAVIIGGTIPQPHLSDFLKSALYGSQDLYYNLTSRPAQPKTQSQDAATNVSNVRQDTPAPTPQTNTTVQASNTTTASMSAPEVSRIPEFSLQPDTEPTTHSYWKPEWKHVNKLEHTLSFFVLGLLISVVYRRFGLRRSVFALFVLSGAIQCIQPLTVTRAFGLDDMTADAIGILSGVALVCLTRAGWRRLRAHAILNPRWN